MKIKMILKKGMVFLFAAAMAVTGVFSLGVMAASGLEGAYISPKSKMGLKYANNFSRDVSKSQIDVPNFMADSDSNGDEPNKSFNAQQVAAGNSDAGQKWHGFAAYAKNHDPSDFWVKYKNVTTANGKLSLFGAAPNCTWCVYRPLRLMRPSQWLKTSTPFTPRWKRKNSTSSPARLSTTKERCRFLKERLPTTRCSTQ